jgi:hypothetical protein
VDLAAVGEALAVDPMAVGEASVVQALRWLRSGHVVGEEMIVARVRV